MTGGAEVAGGLGAIGNMNPPGMGGLVGEAATLAGGAGGVSSNRLEVGAGAEFGETKNRDERSAVNYTADISVEYPEERRRGPVY